MLIVGPHKVCNGDSITLSAPSGYDNYEWLPDHQTSESITVSPTVSTVYSVSVNDGSISSAAHLVTVYDSPTPDIEYLSGYNLAGEEVWLDAGLSMSSLDNNMLLRVKSDTYKEYHWFSSGQRIVGANYRYYQVIADGSYSVEVLSVNGCTGSSEEIQIEVSDAPSCFARLVEPINGDRNVPVNARIVFDVRFNYYLPTDPPSLIPTSAINISLYDGDSPVVIPAGNMTTYLPGDPLGTDNGYRYIISGIRFRSGSPVKVSVVVNGGATVGTGMENCP